MDNGKVKLGMVNWFQVGWQSFDFNFFVFVFLRVLIYGFFFCLDC